MRRIVLLAVVMAVMAAVAAGITTLSGPAHEGGSAPYPGELPYVPSDITRANEKFSISPSTASWKTTDISHIKQSVVATFRGNVADIGGPIDWHDNVGAAHGAIPVTIRVTENTKNIGDGDYQSGDLFTFYVDSSKIGGRYYIPSYEPEFEVGEDVVVHIARSHLGPMGEGGDNYFVELGDFGKYRVMDQKAHNEKHYDGRPLYEALHEAN